MLPSARNAKPSVGTILTTEVSIVDTCSLVPGLPAPRGWQLSSASTLHTHSPSRCRVVESGPIRCWLLIRDSTARVYKRQGDGGPNYRPVGHDSDSDLRTVSESPGLIYSPFAMWQKNKLRVQTRGSLSSSPVTTTPSVSRPGWGGNTKKVSAWEVWPRKPKATGLRLTISATVRKTLLTYCM